MQPFDMSPENVVEGEFETEAETQEIEKEIQEIEELVQQITHCPTCGTELTETEHGPVCITCLKMELGAPTLAQATRRISVLIVTYRQCLASKVRPKYGLDKIQSIIPEWLKTKVDLTTLEEQLKNKTVRNLTANEREFFKLYFIAVFLHRRATALADEQEAIHAEVARVEADIAGLNMVAE